MKLDQIEKKNIFEVPEGYFEQLPMAIQAKVAVKKRSFSFPSFFVSVKYAFPILCLALISFLWYQHNALVPNHTLNDVSTETLVAYLSESDITEDELLVYIDNSQLDFHSTLVNTIDTISMEDTTLEKLSTDFENEYF
jgi:hypothetical protein